MYSALIIILLVLFFAVSFSLQNSEPITLNFFSWTIESSQAVVFLSALTCGVLLGVLASLPYFFKKSRLISHQQKTIAKLEAAVAEPEPMPAHTEDFNDATKT